MWLAGLYNSIKKKMGIGEFREVFLELYPDLCVYAAKFVTDEHAAKDIVQDVFTSFWLENDKLRNKKLIRPYLFKSVKHKALNYKKRESRKSGLDVFFDSYNNELANSENESIESFLALSGLKNDLEMAIAELPEQRQKIFRMSRFDHLSHKEIAQELDLSVKTVETQIYRSLKFLREKLKHHLE